MLGTIESSLVTESWPPVVSVLPPPPAPHTPGLFFSVGLDPFVLPSLLLLKAHLQEADTQGLGGLGLCEAQTGGERAAPPDAGWLLA